MKIINASELTRNELALIKEAIDFRFTNSICFRNYDNDLTIEIRTEKKVVQGDPVDQSDIEAALNAAELVERKASRKYYDLQERFFNYCESVKGYQNDPAISANLQEMRRTMNSAEAAMGNAGRRVAGLKSILQNNNGGSYVPSRTLLGEFIPSQNPKVVLYLGSYHSDKDNRYYTLIPTFVHEMFHAVNYFVSGGSGSIREVDEPMVEFATKVFLEAASDSNYEFKILANNHRFDVQRKFESIGEIACYGFGRYLMDNVASLSTHNEVEWIEEYSKKASSIMPTIKEAKEVMTLLYPFYPADDEQKVLNLLEVLIFGGNLTVSLSTGPVLSSSHKKRKTPAPATGIRITRKDGSILQMRTAGDTLVQAIIEAGPMNVYNLGIICCGFPLVANSISPKYGLTQVEVLPGIYVMKHSNTKMKKGFLDRISDALGLGWKVDIV